MLKISNDLFNFVVMRPLYLFVWFCLSYSLRLFFKSVELLNAPKSFFGRTIYVSNHPASFMDPLVISCFRRPILFFMTRSDVFTPISRPILWLVHMLPIYRQIDGVNTKDKNQEVFKECSKVLKGKRNLLIFGEGFTDDVFVRRLKPIKKGAVRIGFAALDAMNWSEKVYLAAVGCNYSDPSRMRSDLLIATSDQICLNDFKDAYEANSNKVISELTHKLDLLMKSQITHVENPHLVHLHEGIMILTRRGMNAESYDSELTLIERFEYSKKIALWLNNNSLETLEPIKERIEFYFNVLKNNDLTDDELWRLKENKIFIKEKFLKILVLLPFFALGIIHCAIPYLITKKFVEGKFKRPVFWSSTKMLISMILIGILNIPVIFFIVDFFSVSVYYGLCYYLLIGIFGLSAYRAMVLIKQIIRYKSLRKRDLHDIFEERERTFEFLKITIPEEFS
jgi:1-acyl-sn-glycerol-3-phosphate acyltransferase